MPFLNDLKAQTSELLAQQTLTTKIMAGGVLLVLLVALGSQGLRLGRTLDYELLYAGEIPMKVAINTLSVIPGRVGGGETYLVNLVKIITHARITSSCHCRTQMHH